MMLDALPEDELAKVLVHRHEDPVLCRRPSEELSIARIPASLAASLVLAVIVVRSEIGSGGRIPIAMTDRGGDEEPTGGGNGGGESESPSESGGADLTIVDFSFSPQDLSVTEGQTITVSNFGETSHTFTTDDGAIDETISPGDTVEITMTGVSSGGFHCRFHSQMTGNLTVG